MLPPFEKLPKNLQMCPSSLISHQRQFSGISESPFYAEIKLYHYTIFTQILGHLNSLPYLL